MCRYRPNLAGQVELEDMVGVVGGAQAAPPDAVVPPQLASGFSPVGVELHDEPNWKSR